MSKIRRLEQRIRKFERREHNYERRIKELKKQKRKIREALSKERFEAKFKEAVEAIGPDITLYEFRRFIRWGTHANNRIREYYGSWNHMKRHFGLPVNKPGRKKDGGHSNSGLYNQ